MSRHNLNYFIKTKITSPHLVAIIDDFRFLLLKPMADFILIKYLKYNNSIKYCSVSFMYAKGIIMIPSKRGPSTTLGPIFRHKTLR
jgi:hypothetical protein